MKFDIDAPGAHSTLNACDYMTPKVQAARSRLGTLRADVPGSLPHSPLVSACFAEYLDIAALPDAEGAQRQVDEAVAAGRAAVGSYERADLVFMLNAAQADAAVCYPDYDPSRFGPGGFDAWSR